jgi:hypothetical protein
MKRALAFALLLAAATASQALPLEIAVEYRLSSLGATIGHVSEQFVRTGDTYSITSVTRSEGVLKLVLDDSITLKSEGRIDAGGLQPLMFEQKRAGNHSKDIHATFDWERGVLVSRFAGETREVALPKATQDRISVMYQFMSLTQSNVVEMNMSNGRKVERYKYRFVDEVRLSTPAGDFDTLHYARVTDSPKENKAEVWLAKDRFNIPVRVIFDDPKGPKLEQVVLSLRVR